MRSLMFLLLISLVFSGALATAQGQWEELFPTNHPAARCQPDMVPIGNGDLFYFGGEASKAGGSYFGDTWTWNGSDWTELFPALSPSPRCPVISYDPVRDRVVLFSGWDGNGYLPDTWEWDGSNWTDVTPAVSPAARSWTDMAYYPVSGKTLLLSGRIWQNWGNAGAFDDFWSWDGTSWTQLFPNNLPPARSAHCMAYNKKSGTMIMVGGFNNTSMAGKVFFNDMWEWDGADWTELFPAQMPGPRQWATMVYDESRDVMVLYGGKDTVAGTLYNDVWEWNGVNWKQTSTSGPTMGWAPGAYDAHNGRVLIQGGSTSPTRNTVDDKTWLYGMGGLKADVAAISEAAGGKVNFTLNAGKTNAGRNYLIFAGVTGTTPGFTPPPGLVTIPVNWDLFTNLALKLTNTTIFQNFYGTLDANGQAVALFDTLGPFTGGAGLTLNFAFGADLSYWDYASNAVSIDVTP